MSPRHDSAEVLTGQTLPLRSTYPQANTLRLSDNVAFDEPIPARRKAILDTVIAYIRDRHSPRSYYQLEELARELPISKMAAAGAMTHLEEHSPYTVRRDDVGGEIAWFVSGMID